MRRISLTAIILIAVVCWQAYAPTQGHPAGGRRLEPEQSSARHRDDLLVGSDFLDMFIASPASAVRSRRYPPDDEHRNRPMDRSASSRVESRYLDYPRDVLVDNRDSSERMSGLIRSRDRTPSYSQYRQSEKLRPEDDQRGVRKFKKIPAENDFGAVEDEAAGAEKRIHEAMAADKTFGVRTAPRTNIPTSATSLPSTEQPSESAIDDDRPNSSESSVTSTVIISVSDVTTNSRVPVKELNVPVSPKFSVSSSVQKKTSRGRQNIRNVVSQSTQIPVSYSDVFPSTSQDMITEVITPDIKTSSTLDVQFTSSDSSQHTTDTHTTLYEATTITTSVPDFDSTESLEDWSAKSDGSTLVTTGISDENHTQTPYLLTSDTPTQVVSVRVSSSVAQTPLSKRKEISKTNSVLNTIPTESSPDSFHEEYLNELPAEDSRETAGSLIIAEQPPATSIQRSDFSVEESSPSEVTSDPHTGYSSYHATSFTSGPSSDPQVSPVSYQTSVTTATSGSSVQFFSKPPSYRRGLAYLRRTTTDPTTPVVSNPRRHISLHAIPRAFVPRSSTSLPHALRREPVSAAESIQRSVIANQDEEEADSKDRIEGGRGIKSFQTRDSTGKSYRHQEKVYGEPEKVYGEPEKVYGEPEKVYGEPSKVYGEPAKVYGEPAKVYGEPAKVYGEPSKVYGEPSKVYGEPAKVYGKPAQVYSEPAKVYGEPSKVYGEPAKVYGEPSKSYAEPEQNYEVDESASVDSNGRAHGVQLASTPQQDATTPADTAMKVFDTRQQDPNHKFGYVVEGRDYRKYRVEERTSDGFIVGEYGVVSHDGGNLRGVRYTADGTINPRLIYDTLLKFLSL